MAVHWTDFPERVELFGDLFNILETLEQDVRNRFIHSGSHEKETEQSAYSVTHSGGRSSFVGVFDRIPGLAKLLTFAEREGAGAICLDVLRWIRGRASESLDIPSLAVNDLSIEQVADALLAGNRDKEEDSGSDPLAEFRWLKVTQVAAIFAVNRGQVSKLADAGTFATNGENGYERRIDVLSVVKWVLDRLDRQTAGEGLPEGG